MGLRGKCSQLTRQLATCSWQSFYSQVVSLRFVCGMFECLDVSNLRFSIGMYTQAHQRAPLHRIAATLFEDWGSVGVWLQTSSINRDSTTGLHDCQSIHLCCHTLSSNLRKNLLLFMRKKKKEEKNSLKLKTGSSL